MASLDRRVTRSVVVHAGIEYTGECIRTPRWDDAFGEQLRGDTYFRVVFLEGWPPSPPGPRSLQDQRIAVCVLGKEPGRPLEQSSQELRTVREAYAQYLAGPSSAEVARREAEAQLLALEERVNRLWSEAYLTGNIHAEPPLESGGASVFADGGSEEWAERLGSRLLARAYPLLPMSVARMPRPLRPDQDLPLVFDGLFTARPSAAAAQALDAFAPALGLASVDAPRHVNLSGCHGFQLVQAELTAAGDFADGERLGWRLAHVHGVTYPLATLFTLLFLTQGNWEIQLRPGHPLTWRGGLPLDANRLTGSDLPNLSWPGDFWAYVAVVRPSTEDPWERAVPYLRELPIDLTPADVRDEEEQRRLLRQLMGHLNDGLQVLNDRLENLVHAQGRQWEPANVPELGQLQAVARLDDELALPGEAERVFGGVPGFHAAMELWRGWSSGLTAIEPLIDGLSFLDLAEVPEDHAQLFTDRQTLLQQLRDSAVVVEPYQWQRLVETVVVFRRHYAAVYLRHHEAYHGQMATLGHRMAEVRRAAHALELLNTITELGRSVAVDLPPLVEELYNTIASCSAKLVAAVIEGHPLCPMCGVRLSTQPPTQEVESLGSYVNEALQEQNHRLSGWVVHRLVAGEQSEEIDRFIKVVQVSDLSGLAHVLDDSLVRFIRDLLKGPAR